MSYKCPKCGQTESFHVLRSLWGTVDGNENITEESWEDLGWDLVCCATCAYTADYDKFQV